MTNLSKRISNGVKSLRRIFEETKVSPHTAQVAAASAWPAIILFKLFSLTLNPLLPRRGRSVCAWRGKPQLTGELFRQRLTVAAAAPRALEEPAACSLCDQHYRKAAPDAAPRDRALRHSVAAVRITVTAEEELALAGLVLPEVPLPHEGQSTVLSSRSVLMKPHSGQPVQPMNIPQRERFTATGLPQSGQLVPGGSSRC